MRDRAGQVGDGARQLQGAVICSCAHVQLAHGRAQQAVTGVVHRTEVADLAWTHTCTSLAARCRCIGVGQKVLGVVVDRDEAPSLDLVRGLGPRPDYLGRLVVPRRARSGCPAPPSEPESDPEPEPASICQIQKRRPKWTALSMSTPPSANYLSRNNPNCDQRNRPLTSFDEQRTFVLSSASAPLWHSTI